MDLETAREQALQAADRLFYGRGLQNVGMAEVRDASGVSLKRLYQLFPSKETLIAAYLSRRDARWRAELMEYVERNGDTPRERILLVFDSLEEWFEQPDFRGCAFIHAFGELGACSELVAATAREHKNALFDFLGELTAAARVDEPEAAARQIVMLIDGAMVSSAFTGDPAAARLAKQAAATLLETSAAAGSRRAPARTEIGA